jgi:hypothetical protein
MVMLLMLMLMLMLMLIRVKPSCQSTCTAVSYELDVIAGAS